jgi:hypothetical protein
VPPSYVTQQSDFIRFDDLGDKPATSLRSISTDGIGVVNNLEAVKQMRLKNVVSTDPAIA